MLDEPESPIQSKQQRGRREPRRPIVLRPRRLDIRASIGIIPFGPQQEAAIVTLLPPGNERSAQARLNAAGKARQTLSLIHI
eukprot:99806-Pyramimonas_sp.AAC.1